MSYTATDRKVSKDLSAEIDAAINEINAEIASIDNEDTGSEDKEDKPADKPADEDIPSDEDLEDDEGADDESPDAEGEDVPADEEDDEEDAVSDELLERAVRSGFSMKEARSFKDATLLEKMCDKLDSQTGTVADKADSKEGGSEDPLDGIPDINIDELDPEIYDESVISAAKGVNILKGIVRSQNEQIASLRDEIGSLMNDKTEGAIKGYFDSKVSNLDKEYTKAMKEDPKMSIELRDQYDILLAGYKASGKNVSNDTVFEQAVSIVMGDVKTSIKGDQLKNRKGQFISRPGKAKAKMSADPMEEIADKIDGKYFAK